jgi:hypothetical protein
MRFDVSQAIQAVQIVSGVPKTSASDLPMFSGAQILELLVAEIWLGLVVGKKGGKPWNLRQLHNFNLLW